MRRSTCLLAILGMAASAAAEDLPVVNKDQAAPSLRSMQFFSANPDIPASSSTPQRFRRGADKTADDDSDLKNYYQELFGEQGKPGEVSAESPSTRLRGVVPTSHQAPATLNSSGSRVVKPIPEPDKASAATAGKSLEAQSEEQIIHAEFQHDSQIHRDALVQPVRAMPEQSRAFPGAGSLERRRPTGFEDTGFHATTESIPASSESHPFEQTATVPVFQTPPAAARTALTPIQVDQQPASVKASSAIASPSLTVEWRKTTDLSVGQECVCELVVSNPGQTAASRVELTASLPKNLQLVKTNPPHAETPQGLTWEFSTLEPGVERVIQLNVVPLARGEIAARAEVRFSGAATADFAIAEPLLELQIESSQQMVTVGEMVTQLVTVSNPGSGVASDVQLEALIPHGLEHARGQRLSMDLGSLNPGESRSVRLALGATEGGKHHVQLEARSGAGLVKTAQTEVTVVAPSLAATIQGPGLRYVGRQGVFTLTVANDGTSLSDNVRVMHKIPNGFQYVSSDRGAQYDPASRLLTWFVGPMEQGQRASIQVTLKAEKTGEFKHLVRAVSEHGAVSDTELTTSVEGTSSLAVQIRDLDDPVEIGTETAYEIKIRNEGSAAAKNVRLACELPAGMKMIHAEGPTQHRAEQGVLMFQPLSELGAGESVTFQVHVTSSTSGSLRFRAHLSSDSITDPLVSEELTKFYGE